MDSPGRSKGSDAVPPSGSAGSTPATGHPYRPLFVEVPREPVKPRFGALDMTALAPVIKGLHGR